MSTTNIFVACGLFFTALWVGILYNIFTLAKVENERYVLTLEEANYMTEYMINKFQVTSIDACIQNTCYYQNKEFIFVASVENEEVRLISFRRK